MATTDIQTELPSVKDQIRSLLDRLPEDCSLEDVQYHLFALGQIHKGIAQIERGDVVSHDEVKRRIRQWTAK